MDCIRVVDVEEQAAAFPQATAHVAEEAVVVFRSAVAEAAPKTQNPVEGLLHRREISQLERPKGRAGHVLVACHVQRVVRSVNPQHVDANIGFERTVTTCQRTAGDCCRTRALLESDQGLRERRFHSPRAERIMARPPVTPSATRVQKKKRPPGDLATAGVKPLFR